jgi:hypothetical protein
MPHSLLATPVIDSGQITDAEADRVLWADIVMCGGAPDAPAYLVVQVSRTVSERDIRLAIRRAAAFRQANSGARPVVAGQRIRRSAAELADRLGVGRMFECEFDDEDPIVDDDIGGHEAYSFDQPPGRVATEDGRRELQPTDTDCR